MRRQEGAFNTPILRDGGMREGIFGGGAGEKGLNDKQQIFYKSRSDFSQLSLQAWQAPGVAQEQWTGGHWLGYLSSLIRGWGIVGAVLWRASLQVYSNPLQKAKFLFTKTQLVFTFGLKKAKGDQL